LGAAFGAASAMRGARAGAILGAPFGPAGAAAGGITGAVLTGIFTGSAVSAITSTLGRLFDREFLPDRECHACGELFRTSDATFAPPGSFEPQNPAQPEPSASTVVQGFIHPTSEET
jgi:hypothetical protein